MLPLLAALPGSAGAAAPCLARACLQLKAKSRLAAGKIAAGLQDVIAGHGKLLTAPQAGALRDTRYHPLSCNLVACQPKSRVVAPSKSLDSSQSLGSLGP